MQITLKKDIRLKDGSTISRGTPVSVRPSERDQSCIINDGNREYHVRYTSVFKMPSMDDLEEMSGDCICHTPLGNAVEPDGYDDHGFPSWMLILGVI